MVSSCGTVAVYLLRIRTPRRTACPLYAEHGGGRRREVEKGETVEDFFSEKKREKVGVPLPSVKLVVSEYNDAWGGRREPSVPAWKNGPNHCSSGKKRISIRVCRPYRGNGKGRYPGEKGGEDSFRMPVDTVVQKAGKTELREKLVKG